MTVIDRTAGNRVLIVAFDGLRPDMVGDTTMPTLARFAREGVRFSASRAVFPSETRVNQASLISGAWPRRHGIVGNKFMDRIASPDALINSGEEDELRAADAKLDGALIDVPSLGEILAENGRQLAVVGSGTAGGTRMLHHAAERLGQFRFSLYRPDASTPRERIDDVLDRFGPVPEAKIPSIERLTYATDVYLDYVEPELRPDVAILWFFEPDLTFHFSGVGTPDSLAAIAHADAQFARVLEHRERLPTGEPLHVVTLSDHGHLATRGAPIGLDGKLRAAGFSAGARFSDDVEVVAFCGSAGGIYVRDSDPALVAALRDWLCRQDWCGPVFSRDGADTLTFADVHLDHARAPDLVFITRADDGLNAHGLAGRCPHDWAKLPPGGGIHGGLHPMELATWLAADGPAFEPATVADLPCGIVDVGPTILHLLGLAPPGSMEGRVLAEALQQTAGSPLGAVEQADHEVRDGLGRSYRLTTRRIGEHRYLERGGLAESSSGH